MKYWEESSEWIGGNFAIKFWVFIEFEKKQLYYGGW